MVNLSFFGKRIVRQYYLRNGWIEVSDTGEELDSNIEPTSKTSDYVILAIVIILVITISVQMYSM